MKITLTATLSDEEVQILAMQKWYSSKITVIADPGNPSVFTEIDNPQSPSDFIRQVYEGIIVADATKVFTEYRSAQLKEQQRQIEEAVRQWVSSSITSTIE